MRTLTPLGGEKLFCDFPIPSLNLSFRLNYNAARRKKWNASIKNVAKQRSNCAESKNALAWLLPNTTCQPVQPPCFKQRPVQLVVPEHQERPRELHHPSRAVPRSTDKKPRPRLRHDHGEVRRLPTLTFLPVNDQGGHRCGQHSHLQTFPLHTHRHLKTPQRITHLLPSPNWDNKLIHWLPQSWVLFLLSFFFYWTSTWIVKYFYNYSWKNAIWICRHCWIVIVKIWCEWMVRSSKSWHA